MQGECGQTISGWIKALAHALEEKLGNDVDRLFIQSEHKGSTHHSVDCIHY